MLIAKAARRFAAPLASVILALTPLPALAQDEAQAEDSDRLIATVDGEAVTLSDIAAALSRMPPEYQQQPVEAIVPIMVRQIAISRRIYAQAEAEGLGDDPDVIAQIEQARLGILQNNWLEREVAKQVDDEAIEAAYEEYLEQNPPQDEVSARHILLETEEDAVAVIEELDGGADFVALAEERSTGPSASAGGQLGFFTKDRMVPEFADAAFGMEVGAHSAAPVQSQFGYHVILVEDKRTTEPPSLDELRPQLQAQAEQEALAEIVDGVEEGVEIVYADEEASEDEAADEDGEETATE